MNMRNPDDLFHYEIEPEATTPGVMLVGVEGFFDAGRTIHLLTDHLKESGNAETVAEFDMDQLIDYRGRRPMIVFDEDHFEEYDEPKLTLDRLTDRDGQVYYLLSGAEPDFQWERVINAVKRITRQLGITKTISWQGVPMGIPHTRPVSYTSHGTDKDLLGNKPSVFGRVTVPTAFATLLQLRLGESGHKAMGFAMHVPHYLSESDHPAAALTALNAVSDAADLNLPNDGLVAAVAEARHKLAKALEEQPEVAQLVHQMEEQFDQAVQNPEARGLLPGTQAVPSADELGAEFERFLRESGEDESPLD